MEENKERFLSVFDEHIHRVGSNELLNWIKLSDFFVAPASTRFHGNYKGGLLEHSLNVYDCLRERVHNDSGLRNSESGECTIPEESIAIVGLLHDVCKVNCYRPDVRNVKVDGVWTQKDVFVRDEQFPAGDHSDKSIILIQYFMKLELEEILAIRAHMGGFDNAAKGGSSVVSNIFERSRFALHTHIADIEATYLLEKSLS